MGNSQTKNLCKYICVRRGWGCGCGPKQQNTNERAKAEACEAKPPSRLDLTQINRYYSVTDAFRYIEGRVFQNFDGVKYPFPIDDPEMRRLELGYQVFAQSWGNIFSAPVEEMLAGGGVYVLDVGCGTGRWILDMARKYKDVIFVGIDLVPISLHYAKPENVGFLPCDINYGICFPDATFSWIYQSFMVSTLGNELWPGHIDEMARVTKEGGWCEFMEVDLEFYNMGPTTKLLRDALRGWYRSQNLPLELSAAVTELLEESPRFTDITSKECKVYFGEWAGEHGSKALEILTGSFYGLASILKAPLGVNDKQYTRMVEKIGPEANKHKSYYICSRVLARKAAPKPDTVDEQ